MKRICFDSQFLLAFYDRADDLHKQAVTLFKAYFETAKNIIVLPWPVMYESLNTRFVSNPRQIEEIGRDLTRWRANRRLEFIDDLKFRDDALADCLNKAGPISARRRLLSLVDRVLIAMLDDPNLRIEAVFSNDTDAFTNVCRRNGKELIPLHEV